MEKDLKTLYKDRTEESRKLPPTSRVDNSDKRTDDAKSQVLTNDHKDKRLQQKLTLDKGLTEIDNSNALVNVRRPLPQRTWSDEANGNIIPQSAPGQGLEEGPLGSEQPKPVPAAPRKPVPVPRKPRTAVLAHQEKVEDKKEEFVNHKGREMSAREVKVSLEGKSSSALSVSEPVNENKQKHFVSPSKAYTPPAPPPKKKPFLSAPEKAPTSVSQTLLKDVKEKDQCWDSNIYEMEVSVNKEDKEVEKGERDDQEAVYYNLKHFPLSSSLLTQPELSQRPTITVAAEENRPVKDAPKKPRRSSSPMAQMQRKESSEEKEEKCDNENRHVPPIQDYVLKKAVQRELPLPPDQKIQRNHLKTKVSRSSQSSLSKHKAKSFSGADIIRSEGQRRNSFRKLLDLKLSVRNLIVGGQSPNDANDGEQSVDMDPDECQKFPEKLTAVRKLLCPLIGVEQSVDEEELSPGVEEESVYYEDIPDYVNVQVGKTGSFPRASFSQPTAWDSEMYNDEGIYEEQEPYMSFEKDTEHQQYPAQTAYDR